MESNRLTPKLKLSVTIHWKAVEQYFTVVLFVFQFYPVCNCETFISLTLSGVKGVIDESRNPSTWLITKLGFLRVRDF